jgi:hypothetical protein
LEMSEDWRTSHVGPADLVDVLVGGSFETYTQTKLNGELSRAKHTHTFTVNAMNVDTNRLGGPYKVYEL